MLSYPLFCVDRENFTMGTIPNKARIIQTITKAAAQYKQHLVGKTFLYIFEGRMIEVAYHAEEFRHLTGVAARGLTARSFYDKAVDGTLQENQIYFDANHRLHLCKRKMRHIQNLASVTNSALIVLEDASTETETYHFAFTELKFTLCLGRDVDLATGKLKNNYYIVKSLRDGDMFDRSIHQYECNYIFSRQNDKSFYDTLCYSDAKIRIHDLPDEIKAKLASSLIVEDGSASQER